MVLAQLDKQGSQISEEIPNRLSQICDINERADADLEDLDEESRPPSPTVPINSEMQDASEFSPKRVKYHNSVSRRHSNID